MVRSGTVDIAGEVSPDKYGALNDGTFLKVLDTEWILKEDELFYTLHSDMRESLDNGSSLLVVKAEIQNPSDKDISFLQEGLLQVGEERVSRLDYCGFINFNLYELEAGNAVIVEYCAVLENQISFKEIKLVFNKDAAVSDEKIFLLE